MLCELRTGILLALNDRIAFRTILYAQTNNDKDMRIVEQIAARLIEISLIFYKVDLNAALVVLVHAPHSIYLE